MLFTDKKMENNNTQYRIFDVFYFFCLPLVLGKYYLYILHQKQKLRKNIAKHLQRISAFSREDDLSCTEAIWFEQFGD